MSEFYGGVLIGMIIGVFLGVSFGVLITSVVAINRGEPNDGP